MFTLVLTVDDDLIFDEREYPSLELAYEVGFDDVMFLQSIGCEAHHEVRCNIAF